ncbi:MAG: 30S ribosomal protein S13 [Elusimicrobia bacterium RIFOXYC2_FULL_34_12]|nr:MAG: 30S ribosomal protein S13 [Elusimicrobia bacterium RIFOXYC2_FULL_34_12]OGS38566.1 MAG: 30S ribosomal protein S13 [Elusimicrobia bacterium RIFOXYD2_FULL_34_30]HAM38834.1 30S ribosomal protein S13 [Elusimicrobiota bacterium]
MARISGIDLPKEKRIDIGLSYIYGIGRLLAKRILDEAQIDHSKRVKNLTEAEVSKIATIISSGYKVEGDLRREIVSNIKRLQEIGTYRGMRHRRNLPARGQRTKTNARTKRGKRKTVGAVKAEVKKERETGKA